MSFPDFNVWRENEVGTDTPLWMWEVVSVNEDDLDETVLAAGIASSKEAAMQKVREHMPKARVGVN